MTDSNATELLDGLRNVGNLHEFAELFGFDWHDDSDWTWHDVAVKMADDIEQAVAMTLGSEEKECAWYDQWEWDEVDVPVSDCPYCGCKRKVIHIHADEYEQPDDYFVEHADIREAADCFAEYFAFRTAEEAVRHADARARTCHHVKPRTLEDAIAEYVELSTSQDVKRHREVSDELRKIQREQFRDEPELEFYKESNGYEFYLELPYDELCIYSDKVDVKHHGYSYMYKNPNGGSTYSCSSLCGYSREKIVGMLDANIERIERELLGVDA